MVSFGLSRPNLASGVRGEIGDSACSTFARSFRWNATQSGSGASLVLSSLLKDKEMEASSDLANEKLGREEKRHGKR